MYFNRLFKYEESMEIIWRLVNITSDNILHLEESKAEIQLAPPYCGIHNQSRFRLEVM